MPCRAGYGYKMFEAILLMTIKLFLIRSVIIIPTIDYIVYLLPGRRDLQYFFKIERDQIYVQIKKLFHNK